MLPTTKPRMAERHWLDKPWPVPQAVQRWLGVLLAFALIGVAGAAIHAAHAIHAANDRSAPVAAHVE